MNDINLQVAKEITTSLASGFNGDSRLAAVAFQRIFVVVRKYDDDDAKLMTKDIVVSMGSQFKGSVDLACEAFERILATIIIAKRTKTPAKPEAGHVLRPHQQDHHTPSMPTEVGHV
ncbi:MAG: hypothetical protein ABIH42_00195 [Planctomycetota bacterium]